MFGVFATQRAVSRKPLHQGCYAVIAEVVQVFGCEVLRFLQQPILQLSNLVVRDAKGHESRVTLLPTSLIEPLPVHLQQVRQLHHRDVNQGYGSVYLPFVLERKYPNADRAWIRQFGFPSFGRSRVDRLVIG